MRETYRLTKKHRRTEIERQRQINTERCSARSRNRDRYTERQTEAVLPDPIPRDRIGSCTLMRHCGQVTMVTKSSLIFMRHSGRAVGKVVRPALRSRSSGDP